MSAPTVLPWHRIVGIFASDRARAGVSSLTSSESFAALVAENDPHAAQHQETVRLLEEAAHVMQISANIQNMNRPANEADLAMGLKRVITEIRAHLASLQPAAPAQIPAPNIER